MPVIHRTAYIVFCIFLICLGLLLITVGVLYLRSYIKNRRKPPVERKGANLLGGAYGMGAVGGKPTGAGSMGGVPGMSIPPMNGKKDEEDPRKR